MADGRRLIASFRRLTGHKRTYLAESFQSLVPPRLESREREAAAFQCRSGNPSVGGPQLD
jgi:hypothetical protein